MVEECVCVGAGVLGFEGSHRKVYDFARPDSLKNLFRVKFVRWLVAIAVFALLGIDFKQAATAFQSGQAAPVVHQEILNGTLQKEAELALLRRGMPETVVLQQ